MKLAARPSIPINAYLTGCKRVFNRVFTNLINMRRPLLTLVGNLALKGSYQRIEDCRMYLDLKKPQDEIIKV